MLKVNEYTWNIFPFFADKMLPIWYLQPITWDDSERKALAPKGSILFFLLEQHCLLLGVAEVSEGIRKRYKMQNKFV